MKRIDEIDESEEEFQARVKKAKNHGICIFRDDDIREMILDLIDDYMDLVEAIRQK